MPNNIQTPRSLTIGEEMHALMGRLFPICRSITGNGVRETLKIISELIPLTVHEVPSGTECFDWIVPDEWNIDDAYILTPDGKKIANFKENNLHVVGYSAPFDGEMNLDELSDHIHTAPDIPEAIPYVTSYYQRRWGFCLSHKQFQSLKQGTYRAVIDASLEPGSLTYGDLLLPGDSNEEILLSCNTCHPSLANNELSGPVLLTYLARWLLSLPERRYSYRIVFMPETIGSLVYLSQHLDDLKNNVIAGYHLTCIGGPADFIFIKPRAKGTLSEKAMHHTLAHCSIGFSIEDYTRRASDERQFCAPGIDLPVGVLTKSKFAAYREYHSSLDDLEFVKPSYLEASFSVFQSCLEAIEMNWRFSVTQLGEPNLGRRGLYPTIGGQAYRMQSINDQKAVLAFSDGEHDLIDIADKHGRPVKDIATAAETLVKADLLSRLL